MKLWLNFWNMSLKMAKIQNFSFLNYDISFKDFLKQLSIELTTFSSFDKKHFYTGLKHLWNNSQTICIILISIPTFKTISYPRYISIYLKWSEDGGREFPLENFIYIVAPYNWVNKKKKLMTLFEKYSSRT